MTLLFTAQLLGLVLTRDHYHDVRSKSGEGFEESLAGEMLEVVNEEIYLLVDEIDISQFY